MQMTYSNSEPSPDISDFLVKLTNWSESLSDSQRPIAQLLVEHARELTPQSIAFDRITQDLRVSARAIIDALNVKIEAPQGWVRVDPVWERKNQFDPLEQIEILQRIFVQTRG